MAAGFEFDAANAGHCTGGRIRRSWMRPGQTRHAISDGPAPATGCAAPQAACDRGTPGYAGGGASHDCRPAPRRGARAARHAEKVGDFLELDFRRLFLWLRAGLAAALALALVGALAGGAYGLMAKKRYTVATDILINPSNLQVIDNDLYAQSSQVDGQVLSARSKAARPDFPQCPFPRRG